jgi:hypothetical protein
VNAADAAGAQNGDSDHVFPLTLCRLAANLELIFQHKLVIE